MLVILVLVPSQNNVSETLDLTHELTPEVRLEPI